MMMMMMRMMAVVVVVVAVAVAVVVAGRDRGKKATIYMVRIKKCVISILGTNVYASPDKSCVYYSSYT